MITRRPATTCLALAALAGGLAALSGGCNATREANIDLRKQLQRLEARNKDISRQLQTLRTQYNAAVINQQVERLSADHLAELYTVSGLSFGKLTRGEDVDPDTAGTERLIIHVVPVDARGDQLKAAGSFRIRAVDLTNSEPRIREFTFDLKQSKDAWLGTGLVYGYVLTCPLAFPIVANEATVEVTFTDALTGGTFTEQKVVKLP